MLGRPLKSITLTTNMRKQLESMVRSRTLPQGLARRAKIVLMAADGKSNTDIAEQLNLSRATVGLWRKRFLEQGLMGLYDELRPGATCVEGLQSLGKSTSNSPSIGSLSRKCATLWGCT